MQGSTTIRSKNQMNMNNLTTFWIKSVITQERVTLEAND